MSNRKFYPTPSTTKCYINDVELDDIFRVDFKRNKNHQPIYGYNDEQFGFVAKGKELVTGQIIINFRYPGYLTAVIKRNAEFKEIQDKALVAAGVEERPIDDATILDFIDKQSFDSLSSLDKAAWLANQLINLASGKVRAQVNTANGIIALKNKLRNQYLGDTSSTEASKNLATKYSRMKSPLDYDTSANGFDLTIKYGFQENEGMYKRVFKDCILVGESSTVSSAAGAGNDMSSSAQGILEVYPFFAKTIEIE